MTSLGPYREATNYTHMFDFVDMVGEPTPFTGCSGSILNKFGSQLSSMKIKNFFIFLL